MYRCHLRSIFNDISYQAYNYSVTLSFTEHFRCYVEDMGASEAVISCMLKMDKNTAVQNTGCMALTNLSADCTRFSIYFALYSVIVLLKYFSPN